MTIDMHWKLEHRTLPTALWNRESRIEAVLLQARLLIAGQVKPSEI